MIARVGTSGSGRGGRNAIRVTSSVRITTQKSTPTANAPVATKGNPTFAAVADATSPDATVGRKYPPWMTSGFSLPLIQNARIQPAKSADAMIDTATTT